MFCLSMQNPFLRNGNFPYLFLSNGRRVNINFLLAKMRHVLKTKEIAGFDRGPNASIIATVQRQNPLYRVTLVPSAIVLEISCNKAN